MDRLSQLKGEAGSSRDTTLDTTSPPSEAFITANESSSKFYSLSEVDSTFDISSMKGDVSSIKAVSLTTTVSESDGTITNTEGLISNLSPIGKKSDILDSYKIDTRIEAANILSGGVAIFDDNSYDGNELVIDDNVEMEEKSNSELKQSEIYKADENVEMGILTEEADIASKDTEVLLQIDGRNVDAIDIGNGLYLYRKGQEELAAVQIVDDEQPSFKFLKVRENTEGNLEVYEEIEVEIPKEVPTKDVKMVDKGTPSHLPIKDITKVISESTCHKITDQHNKVAKKETTINSMVQAENKEILPDSKTEVNLNGKMMKFNESRKSPVIGTFTPVTYHSTPKKEGVPLTKIMVDQQLHPNRHSDVSNVKKTIEVHTDSSKKTMETPSKINIDSKVNDIFTADKGNTAEIGITSLEPCNKTTIMNEKEFMKVDTKENSVKIVKGNEFDAGHVSTITNDKPETNKNLPLEQQNCNNLSENVANKNMDINTPSNLELGTIDDSKEIIKTSVSVNDKTQDILNDALKINEDDSKVELTKVEVDVCDIESEVKPKNDSKIELEEANKDKEVEKTVIDDSTPILIEDDDVSIIEVVLENNESEDIASKSECESQVNENNKDNLENSDKITVISKNNGEAKKIVKECKDIISEDNLRSASTIDNTVVHPQLKSEVETFSVSNEQEIKKHIVTEVTDVKKDVVILPVLNNFTDNLATAYPMENISNSIAQEENKDILIKPAINEPKEISIFPNMSDDIQNNKPVKLTERKSTVPKDCSIKHVISANISPLLEQKQQSLVTSKIIADKPILPEKNLDKNLSLGINYTTKINKVVEQNTENKLLELQSGHVPVKSAQIARPTSNVAEIQVSSHNPPAEGSTKSNSVNKVGDGKELRKNLISLPIKNVTVGKPRSTLNIKPLVASQKDDKKLLPKMNTCVMNIEISKVSKLESIKSTTVMKQAENNATSKVPTQSLKSKIEIPNKKDNSKITQSIPINNNHTAVPFGKWTEANRQEFLNKFKTKTSVTSSNSNQLKNSNDLNRRDVLKKIDSQRQSSTALSKSHEAAKHSIKPESKAFSNKPNIITKDSTQGSKISQKTEISETMPKRGVASNTTKIEMVPKLQVDPQAVSVSGGLSKTDICQTKGNVQNLIDKTIEGMIHRNMPKHQSDHKQNINESNIPKLTEPQQKIQHPPRDKKLDEIEMKMNELHGIPFIERPAHELPQLHKSESNLDSIIEKEKSVLLVKTKIPNLLPFANKNQQKVNKESVLEVDSEDEIIEHEPITGDIDLKGKNQAVKPSTKEMLPIQQQDTKTFDASVKEQIITEKDFDKFARRNSITYENCLTVNFDGKEPHNVVQTVVVKETNPKIYSKSDPQHTDTKQKIPHKVQTVLSSTQAAKQQPVNKLEMTPDDVSNRNQSKLQKAYYSALTEKQQMSSEYPITIIEDKPVKVMFVNDVEPTPTQLNVQGQDLSPAKKPIPDSEVTVSTSDSLDSDLLDCTDDVRSQDDVRTKSKHQRKQVLTPVEEPELELIEPKDLGIEVSPKRKRRTDEDKSDKSLKYPMRKKYLLGSCTVTEDKVSSPIAIAVNALKETVHANDDVTARSSPVSALDSLVKAAELIETQTENINNSTVLSSESQTNTPVKRGRGRPRKYPLTPAGTDDKSKVPSPQRKPRLLDAIKPKQDVNNIFLDDFATDSDGEIIRENWTMGKINENIVCPICDKLFRTENVVFKHVKHCTGPSPNRSDSDRRKRISQDSDSKSDDMDDDEPLITQKLNLKKRKSKDSSSKSFDKDDVILIEDTPIKEPEKNLEQETSGSRKSKSKVPLKNNSLVCELCGKTFRQLSYLVNHKLQHKKTEKLEQKKIEKETLITNKHSCEVCKKVFRKLHHLVQHRIIHNPSSAPARTSRKSSSEQLQATKEPSTAKQNEDPSAGFRCEPCDKSFRKLHHLVEHRETHDGINRQKTSPAQVNREDKVEKPVVFHQCDICKKTFRKLIHLNEHKEQHAETSSEKSDDKSIKSSLSTKDIIHECSLCYMVFPNEHSLNKHTVICQRKKRQSKQPKPTDEAEGGEEVIECPTPEEKVENVDSSEAAVKDVKEETQDIVEKEEIKKDEHAAKESSNTIKEKSPELNDENDKISQKLETTVLESQMRPAKRAFAITQLPKMEVIPEVIAKKRKLEPNDLTKIQDTPKKKTAAKDKMPNVTKRVKSTTSTSVTEDNKPGIESSDDEDIRYMLNPNFKVEDTVEKVFLKVKAKKRSSLLIERPDSKDLMKRRSSIQHPPKIPRRKSKVNENNLEAKKEVKSTKTEVVPSTDSDDSEATKYSFPLTIPEKARTSTQNQTPKESKSQKKSLIDKSKSLSSIAKRKSLGKMATARHKLSPLKQIKKRLDLPHKCDCGQLFGSAALLSRHTTLAHTPPRIRRKRSPPPAEKPALKIKSTEKPKQTPTPKKSNVKVVSNTSKTTKSASGSKSNKIEKPRRSAHRGVPVPEKMRKMMDKFKFS